MITDVLYRCPTNREHSNTYALPKLPAQKNVQGITSIMSYPERFCDQCALLSYLPVTIVLLCAAATAAWLFCSSFLFMPTPIALRLPCLVLYSTEQDEPITATSASREPAFNIVFIFSVLGLNRCNRHANAKIGDNEQWRRHAK